MPVIHVYGTSFPKKKEIKETVVEQVSAVTGTPKEAIYVYLHQMEEEDVQKMAPVVQFFWAENAASRGPEQKKQLMKALTDYLADVTGQQKAQVVVTFVDLPLTNVALGGQARG